MTSYPSVWSYFLSELRDHHATQLASKLQVVENKWSERVQREFKKYEMRRLPALFSNSMRQEGLDIDTDWKWDLHGLQCQRNAEITQIRMSVEATQVAEFQYMVDMTTTKIISEMTILATRSPPIAVALIAEWIG